MMILKYYIEIVLITWTAKNMVDDSLMNGREKYRDP